MVQHVKHKLHFLIGMEPAHINISETILANIKCLKLPEACFQHWLEVCDEVLV